MNQTISTTCPVCSVSRRGSKRHIAVSRQSRHGADVRQSESSELHLTFVLAFAYLVYFRGAELIPLLAFPRCTSLPASATTSTDVCRGVQSTMQALHSFQQFTEESNCPSTLGQQKRQRHLYELKLHL